MRYCYKYRITSIDKLVKKLLNKSKTTSNISILLSNHNKKINTLPKRYMNYDLIAGVDKIKELTCNQDSFSRLGKFYDQNNDWMFGYLSYDLKNEIENLHSANYDGIRSNQLSFFIPKYVLLVQKNILKVLSFELKPQVDYFIDSLSIINIKKKHSITLSNRETKQEYLNKISAIQDHIQKGDIYEMNYCIEYFAKDILIDSEALFWELNKVTKTPFAGFYHSQEHYILCASPERFLRKNNNSVIAQPIKGTMRRGKDIKEDQIFIEKLNQSHKNISENIMITDLVRNDLSITAKRSSVQVDELCKVYTFENVHQMISTIISEVNNNINIIDLLQSTFPMGSMTGAPKLKAMDLIEKHEEFRRGLFSGSIGYITPDRDFDFNVIIRTILYNSENQYLSVGVGGAITIKSEPEEEYEECLLKIKPILDLLDQENNER